MTRKSEYSSWLFLKISSPPVFSILLDISLISIILSAYLFPQDSPLKQSLLLSVTYPLIFFDFASTADMCFWHRSYYDCPRRCIEREVLRDCELFMHGAECGHRKLARRPDGSLWPLRYEQKGPLPQEEPMLTVCPRCFPGQPWPPGVPWPDDDDDDDDNDDDNPPPEYVSLRF